MAWQSPHRDVGFIRNSLLSLLYLHGLYYYKSCPCVFRRKKDYVLLFAVWRALCLSVVHPPVHPSIESSVRLSVRLSVPPSGSIYPSTPRLLMLESSNLHAWYPYAYRCWHLNFFPSSSFEIIQILDILPKKAISLNYLRNWIKKLTVWGKSYATYIKRG